MENLSEILQPVAELLTDKKLKDKDLLVDPVELKAEKSHPIDQGDVTFSLGAQGALTVQLFNDENDKDPDEFISAKPDTHITFKPASQAYLKYQAIVTPKANSKGKIQDIGFEFETEASVKIANYKIHNNNESIKDASTNDIKGIHTILKWECIQNLPVNDAVTLNVGGKLSAGLEISWSNIFSQSLSSITANLPYPVTLDLNLSPELSASFNVTISDQFSYLIKRTAADQLFVAVSKIKKSTTSASLGASVGVAFSKPEELEKQLNTIVDELIKAIVKKAGSSVEKAIEAANNGTATTPQLNLINEVAEVLGLGAVPDLVEKVEERWKKLKEDLKAGIKKVAEFNAELSFTYEYERIKEGKELLAIKLPDTFLEKHHPKLLRFKLSKLLAELPGALATGKISKDALNSYLNQNSLTIKKTWGFGLKVFGNQLLEGKNFDTRKTEAETTLRSDFKGHKKINQQRAVGYSWQLGKGEGKWLTELNARMKNYSAGTEPLFAEAELSWYLNMTIKDSKVKADELRAYLDMGVLWGAVQQQDVEGLVDKYFSVLKNKSATFESKLILSEQATRTIIQQAGFHQFDKTNQEVMARSLAAALNYSADYPLRADVKAREDAYAPLWLSYLNAPQQTTRALAATAFEHLRKLPNASPQLLAREKEAGLNNQGFCFADVVYLNAPYTTCANLFKGLHELGSKISLNAPVGNNFIEATDKLTIAGKQSFYLRALGSFLHRCANQNTMLKKEVQRVFTITYQEGGKEIVVNLSII
jgi:hypothetical protein